MKRTYDLRSDRRPDGYDASGALTKIWHYSGANANSAIAVLGYTYDAAGNVTKLVWDDDLDNPNTWNVASGRATITYLYDDLHRLTREYCSPGASSARREYGYEYWYDGVGNRTKLRFYNAYHEQVYNEETELWEWVPGWETTTSQYSARNELTSMYEDAADTTTTLSYDLRGNLTKKGSVEYYWDAQDHMTKVVNGGTTVQYKYDLMGRRVAKKVGSGDWRWYFYDGLKVAAEGTGASSRLSYTLGPGDLGGIVSRSDPGGGTLYYHYDRLGNVVAVTDGNGNLVDIYSMDAFGNVLQVAQSGYGYYENANSSQPYHLTTKEFDGDAGLYYFNARWYDPTTGRFVASDLPGQKGREYSYVGNKPTFFVDPDGHDEVDPKKKECCLRFCDRRLKQCLPMVDIHMRQEEADIEMGYEACNVLEGVRCGLACIVTGPAYLVCFHFCTALGELRCASEKERQLRELGAKRWKLRLECVNKAITCRESCNQTGKPDWKWPWGDL